jgi:hypothetical protein
MAAAQHRRCVAGVEIVIQQPPTAGVIIAAMEREYGSPVTPPISKNAPRAGPGAVHAGVRNHRGNPTPWTLGHD